MMVYLLLLVSILILLLGPQLWVHWIMDNYNRRQEANFPGDGGELARHLLDRFSLQSVSVERATTGDHYDPAGKAVRLTEDKLKGRTLTAITTAAHEVGHALQDAADEPMFRLRTRLVVIATLAQRIGSFLLFAAPLLTLATRAPAAGLITVVAAFLVMGANVVVQMVTLPVEMDASFNKALPLLKSGYLAPDQYAGARRILRAASMTYLSASLAGLLNFWQWLRVLRR
jgi:uncharacterized protein